MIFLLPLLDITTMLILRQPGTVRQTWQDDVYLKKGGAPNRMPGNMAPLRKFSLSAMMPWKEDLRRAKQQREI